MSLTREEQPSGRELLKLFETFLDTNPNIDEIGIIHPSQFATLGKGEDDNKYFWVGENKLAISAHIVQQLYNAAKEAFFTVKNDVNVSEEIMLRHSKAVLLVNANLASCWNARKLIVSKKQEMSAVTDELILSAIVLSYSPKSDQTWAHRRWVLKTIAGKCDKFQDIIGQESDLVEKVVERSKMNYYAWNHRCWLVSYMTREKVLFELKKSRSWSSLHVSDNSCFHYRHKLLRYVFEKCCFEFGENSSGSLVEARQIFLEELDWNEGLIKRYVGREALWIHRRSLSQFWRRFSDVFLKSDIDSFLDNELCLVNSCLTINDNEFGDFEKQATLSATYFVWLLKNNMKPSFNKIRQKLRVENLKNLLDQTLSERSSLWRTIPAFVDLTY